LEIAGLVLPRKFYRIYITVTPKGRHPTITIPKIYVTDENLHDKEIDNVFPVFHYPVDESGLS